MNTSSFGQIVARQRVAVAIVLACGAVLYLLVLPHFRKYVATSTLLLAQPSVGSSSVLDPSKDPISSSLTVSDLEGLAASGSVLTHVSDDLHLTEAQAYRLGNEVRAKNLFSTDIMPLQVSDPDPSLAVREVNAVASELSAFTTNIATSRYDQLISDLKGQTVARRSELAKIDARLQELTGSNFYLTPDTGTTAINQRLIALEQQEQQIATVADGDASNAEVVSKRPELTQHLAGHEIVTQDPALIALRTQYGRDLAQLVNVKAGYTPEYAGIAGLQDTVDRERTELSAEEKRATSDLTQSSSYVAAMLDENRANATLSADRSQLATVRDQLAELDAKLNTSGPQGRQIAALRRERIAGESAYAELYARMAKAVADRAQAASIGSVVVIDRATFATPSLLGQPGVLGVAFAIVFLWLAVTLAFMLDNPGKRIASVDAVENLYGKPVLTPVG